MAYVDKVSLGGTLYDVTDTKGRAMIAPKEETSTASAAHAEGTYFTYNDLLYRATADISAGGTITPNTNCVAVTVGAETSELKSELMEDVTGLHNSLTIDGLPNGSIIPVSMYTLENTIIKGDGTDIQTISNYKCTPIIELYTNDLVFTGGFFPYDLYNTFVLYDASMNVLCRAKGDTTVKLSDYPTAKYMRAAMSMVDDTFYVKIDHAHAYEYLSDLNKYYTSPDPIRLPDSYYTLTGKILNSTATDVMTFSGWNTTPYIELFSNDVCFSGSFFTATSYRTFALYDKDYTVLVFGTYNNVLCVSDFPTAKYFRASMATNDPNAYYVNISNSDPRKTIHVGPGQAFETLRAGINMATGLENSTVIVHAGTYDLTQEFASEIEAATGGVKGIHLYNGVHVIFLSGAYVTALFPQSSAWISNYFNPFYGRDFTLEGLNIKASNCRYCVHDEQAGADVQYHNVFKDCVMQMTAEASSGATLLCTQCIGGGLGKYGYIEIIGGHYTSLGNNGVDGRPAISYHNGGTAGCDSKLFFRDLYIAGDGFLRFGCHGPSSIKSQVYISGCSMGAAIKKFYEEPSDQSDNFEIVEWNNAIR